MCLKCHVPLLQEIYLKCHVAWLQEMCLKFCLILYKYQEMSKFLIVNYLAHFMGFSGPGNLEYLQCKLQFFMCLWKITKIQ